MIDLSAIAIIVAAVIGIFVYFVKWQLEKRSLEYKRKEERYTGMLKSMQGFYKDIGNKDAKQKFINEFNLAWLYASDDVIRAVNKFFNTIKAEGVKSSDNLSKIRNF